MKDTPYWMAPIVLLGCLFVTQGEAPLAVVVAAVGPAVAYGALVVALVQPRERLPLLVALFLWGAAVAAPLAERLNAALGTLPLGPIVWGPLVEETGKALGLVVLTLLGSDRIRDVRTGIACGALVGLGFASAENLGYHLLAVVQGGPSGLARAVFLRGVLQGLNHATFSAAAGAGLGFARAARQEGASSAAPALGFAVAVVQHGAWNGVASHAITDLLCGAVTADDACLASPTPQALYLQVPLLVALFIGPGLAALAWLASRPLRPSRPDP
jgi:RsiW-degrading membrane proteinase PrsW (M82 family)